jgi:2-polyprenyl-3-methyl-5-hydroxy-6-metoxy-1,4-benzoquinol methylase
MDDFFSKLHTKSTGRFLEIGSRARSGNIRKNLVPKNWSYTGFDIIEGANVDVVGDAHRISQLLPEEKFDGVATFSVLEHILMPWKFVIEVNKVLNIGAIGFFSTHQSWPLHDVPWDFWRFSDNTWAALLNRDTGFEIISTALGEPAYTVAHRINAVTNFGNQPSFLSSVVQFRKVSDTKLEWPVELEDIITTKYPARELKN